MKIINVIVSSLSLRAAFGGEAIPSERLPRRSAPRNDKKENMNLNNLLSSNQIKSYLQNLQKEGVSSATIKRKEAALNKFLEYAKAELGFGAVQVKPKAKFNLNLPKFALPQVFGLTAFGLLILALGYFGYQQLVKRALIGLAYPTDLASPSRILSFQGRLTDTGGTPITSGTNFVFKLYDAEEDGDDLWTSSTCSVTPDQDGIFTVRLGDTGGGSNECGGAIASTVFSENIGVWLEVTVSDEVLDPRQPIATSAYALNAETLQGFPPGTGTSNILYIDSTGNIGIGVTSPTLDASSSSGTFGIQAQALSLSAVDTSNGNITINPDGTGVLDLVFEGASPGGSYGGFVNAENANLASGALYYGKVASDASGYDFLQFVSGASPTEKFSIDNAGNTYLAGTLTVATDATISGTLSLAPQVQAYAGTCNASAQGKMYYDASADEYYFCDGSSWKAISSGSGSIDGSGIANYVPLWSDTDSLTSSVLYQSSGNVGIGTTNPQATLEINGSLKTSSWIRSDSWVKSSYFIDVDNENYTIDPGNTTLSAKLAGNVGIGTTGPGYKLDVSGTGRFTSTLSLADGSTSTPALNFSSDTDTGIYR
ncbi:MAG: hypothetical protein ABIB61_00690, partial [Candidatus Shapirobacteria bacterium]